MGSFSTALSGLHADSTALSVVGDNLANMNTQGFKGNDISFEDAINEASSTLQIGAGVGTTVTNRNFTQGSIQPTGQPLDLALQGNGFFMVQDTSGQTMYTRDGSFQLNAQGQLTTSTGELVQGWTAVNSVVNASGTTSAITVPLLGPKAPVATQNMSTSVNLNANAKVGDTFSSPVQVYDSVGNVHTLSVTFTNTAAGKWSYSVTIPSADLTGGTGTSTELAKGDVAFDSNGVLTTTTAVPITNSAALADGAATLNINWNLLDSAGNPTLTGFAQTSAASGTTQDGSASGTVTGVSMEDGGLLVANYSNGTQQNLGQVAVANIGNPGSMIATNDNNYILGPDSIAPAVGAAGTGGRGNLVSQAIEGSNVDMATEFTNLIVFQQGYDANSKVLSTVNQMDQALLAINP